MFGQVYDKNDMINYDKKKKTREERSSNETKSENGWENCSFIFDFGRAYVDDEMYRSILYTYQAYNSKLKPTREKGD